MIIDCDGCQMRDLACDDCVVTFLLGPPAGLGSAEQTALAVLADGGLVPPLRMAPGSAPGQDPPEPAAVRAGESPSTRGVASA
ncbi:MAG: hypothetical protein OEU98_01855 [Actinomycetota bacterium]|nr:hypothetical protein [Actinomycetota bacterium]